MELVQEAFSATTWLMLTFFRLPAEGALSRQRLPSRMKIGEQALYMLMLEIRTSSTFAPSTDSSEMPLVA